MPSKGQYLVRRGDGTMSTVVAHSTRGALKIWIPKFRPGHGENVSVKLRESDDDWEHFTITR